MTLTTHPQLFSDFQQLPAESFSDHGYICFSLRAPPRPSLSSPEPDFRRVNTELYNRDISLLEAHLTASTHLPISNDLAEALSSNAHAIAALHSPLKAPPSGRARLSPSLRHLLKMVDRAKQRYRRNRECPLTRSAYWQSLHTFRSAYYDFRQQSFLNFLERCSLSPHTLYRILKCDTSRPPPQILKSPDGVPSSPDKLAATLASSLFPHPPPPTPCETARLSANSSYSLSLLNPTHRPAPPITSQEVLHALRHLNNGRAPGDDGLPTTLLFPYRTPS